MKRLARLLIFLSCAATAQVSANGDYEQMLHKIYAGDHEAILSAGSSGDGAFLPALRKAALRFSKSNETAAYDARLALAKLGDNEELQAVECELHSTNPYIQTRALMRKLPYIGGWFSISAYARFLPNTPVNRHGTAEGDSSFGSVMHVSVYALKDMLPDGPEVGINDMRARFLGNTVEKAQEWQQWIEHNKDDLMKLRPTRNYLPLNCPAELSDANPAALRGMVLNAEERGVSGARLLVDWDADAATDKEYGINRSGMVEMTNSKGEFSFDLYPGPYEVCATASGFEKSCKKLRIIDGERAELKLVMRRKASTQK